MIFSTLLTLALSQCGPYTRTRVIDGDPHSHCLYWRENSLIEWHINDQGNPENAGDAGFVAVERALATWQTELSACGSLGLQVGPRTSSRLAEFNKTSPSNQNVVLWRFQNCAQVVNANHPCWIQGQCGNQFDCWQHSSGALAITTTSFEPTTGRILDSDIELNVPGFLFTTVDYPVCVSPNFNVSCVATDIQNALTHEFGHSLGLAHNCQPASTLSAATAPGELSKRSLDLGSRQAVCDIYPRGQPSLDCGTDGGTGGGAGGGSGGGVGGGSGGGSGGVGGGSGGGSGGGGSAPVNRGCGCNSGPAGWLAIVLLARVRGPRQRRSVQTDAVSLLPV